MKNLLILLFVVALSFDGFAQKRSDLTGPAYKNYKPWKHKSESTTIYSENSRLNLTGPAFKNYKPGEHKTEVKLIPIQFGSERSKLTGPEYKHYKPWLKKD